MSFALSLNTQAILLLTAPLLSGRNELSVDLLKPSEYKRFARYLREIQRQPADLLFKDGREVMGCCNHIVAQERLERLVGRGFLLGQVVERWKTRSIWVISRADPQYPKKLKRALKEDAPAVLYGCGDIRLLDVGGLAVVGPRKVDGSLGEYAQEVGKLCAVSGTALISGGARGIDLAAMTGAQLSGGVVCNVMAENLEKAAINRDNREHILNNKLVLVSAYDPMAGFNAGHAMQRNKLIYGLSQAALVVDSMVNKGGTWAGASEQLKKFNFVPVYVRSSAPQSSGLDALKRIGALDWPNPKNTEEFIALLDEPKSVGSNVTMQLSNSLFDRIEEAEVSNSDLSIKERKGAVPAKKFSKKNPGERLYTVIRELLLEMLSSPMSESEVANELNVSKSQARAWLVRLVQEEALTRLARPVRYVVKT